jgi:hypothetical protein
MKLPEDKKQRVQVIILICMGIVAALYVVLHAGIIPVTKGLENRKKKLSIVEDKIEKANRDIMQTKRHKARNAELESELANASMAHLLQHEVGNFLLPAAHHIQKLVEESGIGKHSVRGMGPLQLRQWNKRKNERTVMSYSVRVTVECAYSNLVLFADRMLADNPYVSFSGLSISAQKTHPEKHKMVFDIRWPIWIDLNAYDAYSRMAAKRAAEESSSEEDG